MSEAKGFTYGLALGAGLMFLLDPRQGGARRALVRDKSVGALSDVEEALAVGKRDLFHRAEGVVARLFARPTHEPVSEDVLVERVRARLGHVCDHARAIAVKSKGDGVIELKGPVLADEAERVLGAVAHVRGVREIDDDLERHASAGDVAALQGTHTLPKTWAKMWNPASRLLVGCAAAGLAFSALLRGHPLGFLAGGAGALSIARSMARHGSGVSGRRRIEVPGARGVIASAIPPVEPLGLAPQP